jgi:cytochrome c
MRLARASRASSAVKRRCSRITVWDDANLRAYIADPQAKVPGNRMPFGGLQDTKNIDDIIAYLKTLR